MPNFADDQPLPEETLAAGLIPPDQGVSMDAEATQEATAAADATSTLSDDLQTDTHQQAAESHAAGAEEPAVTDTSTGAELDPSSTAALIQVTRNSIAFPASQSCTSSLARTGAVVHIMLLHCTPCHCHCKNHSHHHLNHQKDMLYWNPALEYRHLATKQTSS